MIVSIQFLAHKDEQECHLYFQNQSQVAGRKNECFCLRAGKGPNFSSQQLFRVSFGGQACVRYLEKLALACSRFLRILSASLDSFDSCQACQKSCVLCQDLGPGSMRYWVYFLKAFIGPSTRSSSTGPRVKQTDSLHPLVNSIIDPNYLFRYLLSRCLEKIGWLGYYKDIFQKRTNLFFDECFFSVDVSMTFISSHDGGHVTQLDM